MITKERIKELAEQSATIWHIVGKNIFNLNADDVLIFYTLSDENWNVWKDDYFETEEDAKFALRYKRIPKTEYLDLPTWEEFITNDKYNYYGSSHFSFDNYRLIVKLPTEDDDCEFIGIDVDGNTEIYDWEEATKENYIEACEICRKLWLGEEVC